MGGADRADLPLRILTITQGQWGERIAENIRENAPSDWDVQTWAAPRVIPPIVDDPEDFLPVELPQVDLIVSLGDVSGLVQLIPEAARMSSAKAVIAPIDRNASLPPGLASQLEAWLTDMDVAVVIPKPFCSLTESTYNRTPHLKEYDDPIIRRFATRFGKPEVRITVEDQEIAEAEVVRDSACGCVRYVSENLIGTDVDAAIEEAGMLHHHYPCLASMNTDEDYRDTLMHVSGNILRDSLRDSLQPYLTVQYIRPVGRYEE